MPPFPTRSPHHRRRFPVSLALAAVSMVGAGVYAAFDGGPGDAGRSRTDPAAPAAPHVTVDDGGGPPPLRRARSVEVEGPATGAAAIEPGPAAYTITYEVNEPGSPSVAEVIAVVQPYASRRTNPTDTTTTAFGRLRVVPASGAPTVVSPPPAAVDPRPAMIVDRAVDEGFLVPREQRRVAGTTCQVYRTRSPVSTSTLSAPLPRSYTDVCLSADGLVLEEWQVEDGRARRHRVAVEVARSAEVEPVSATPTLTAAQGGGSVLAVEPTSRPEGRFFEVEPPAGFARRGRYSVVPPQAGLADEKERRRAIASTADVFERGNDVIVVDRGSTLNLDRAFEPRAEGRPVADLGPAFEEPGELLLAWTGPEVRWADDDGRFVRVYGTVDVETVLQVFRSLRITEGGTGLVFTGAPL